MAEQRTYILVDADTWEPVRGEDGKVQWWWTLEEAMARLPDDGDYKIMVEW